MAANKEKKIYTFLFWVILFFNKRVFLYSIIVPLWLLLIYILLLKMLETLLELSSLGQAH